MTKDDPMNYPDGWEPYQEYDENVEYEEYKDHDEFDVLHDSYQRRSEQYTSAELLEKNFLPPSYNVPGLISVGLANLGGRPKIGKSLLAMQLAVAKAAGAPFLGRPMRKGKVLFISMEDNTFRIKHRLHKQGMSGSEDLRFEFVFPALDDVGIDVLAAEISEMEYDLVIIDTFSRLISKYDQNDMVHMNEITGRLQHTALELNMGIVLVDHHKKPNGIYSDPIDDILGSTGKSAPLDTVMGLYRENGKQNFVLKVVGRDFESTEIPLTFNRENLRWETQTNDQGLVGGSMDDRVYEAMLALNQEGKMLFGTAIAKQACMDVGNVNRCLLSLEQRMLVRKLPKQGVVVPYELIPVAPVLEEGQHMEG